MAGLLLANARAIASPRGLLWLSPELSDFEEHARVAQLVTNPTPEQEEASTTPVITDTVITDTTSPAAQTDTDQVESVFGDVLDENDLNINSPKAAEDSKSQDSSPRLANKASTDKSESATGAETQETSASNATDEVPATEPKPAAELEESDQAPAPVIPARVARLRKPIENCLRLYEPILLNSGEHSCWSMMHSFLGWGLDSDIRVGSSKGRRTSVLNWLCENQSCAGRRLFYVSNGRIKGREGPGYQGHAGQFLAMAAQTNAPRETAIRVQGHDFTIEELIMEEQLTCREPSELTFKLIGFAHYLDTDAKWKNDRGESWDFPRVIRAELAQTINGAACGGTHRIMGLTYAVKMRDAAEKPMEGQWWRAKKFVDDYYAYSLTLQNRDGSFSSDWFKRRGNWGGNDRKFQTTGHILEWMVYAADEKQLHDERIVRSVAYLANLMVQHRYHDWEYGPKGHSVRALRLYHERVFGNDWKRPTQVVKRDKKSSSTKRSRKR